MSKRTVFTSITPLPPHISRAAITEFLHDYETMIDINPLITDRCRIPPPPDAGPDEAHCVWYQLTDAVVMPWTASSPTSADGMSAKPKSSNVSYTCAFHPLPDGLQTHCRAPLGVDIRDRWTVGGTEPGEPRQPVELGLASLGAPTTGLYLREDVDLRCNRLMAGFVKKTLKKSHEAVVQKLNTDLSNASMAKSPVEQRERSSSNGNNKDQHIGSIAAATMDKARPVSMVSPLHAQRPAPYRVYPGKQQPWPPVQYQVLQAPQERKQQQPSRPQQYPQPQAQLQPQHHQHHQHPYRQHQHAHSYSHRVPVPAPVSAPIPAPVSVSRKDVPAALAIGPPPSSQQQARQTQLQNQHHQRSLHPFFPQMNSADDHIPVDLSSLSSSPSMSFSSILTPVSTTPSSTSAAATAVSTPASSPSLSMLPSPPALPYDRFKMNASPLTRLQLQLPKVTTTVNNNDNNIGRDLFAEKEQRHSLYQQLLPPLVFSAREVVASEPRRKSTGSDATSFGGSTSSGITGLPFHDLSLCPQPLRIGGQRRRASVEQAPQTLSVLQLQPKQELSKPVELAAPLAVAPAAVAPVGPTPSANPAEETNPEYQYPVMNPYEYNEDDYEDIYVDSPILTSDAHLQHKGAYSPTVFAEMDGGVAPLGSVMSVVSSASNKSNDAKPVVPDWQQRRRFLAGDFD